MIHSAKMMSLPSLKSELYKDKDKDKEKLRAYLKVRMGTLKIYWQRYQQRQQLMRLDAHALKDIGVSRVDAEQEGLKAFWKE